MSAPQVPRDFVVQLAAGTHPLSAAAPGVLGDSTVVVVDDEPANVALLERLLHAAGIGRVHAFTRSTDAVAHCRASRPDLVLLDLHMPELDGFAVLDALRDLPMGGFLPVLVLTADITTEVKQRALAAGAKDFLTKPFDHTEVVLRVRNLLETRALYGELERHNADLRTALAQRVAAEAAAAAEREQRRDRIDKILAGGGFHIVFQPVADLATGEVVGAEALTRFPGEPRRPPNEWFAEAAELGRGVDLEIAAVQAALAQFDALPRGAFMSINVSASTAISGALGEILDDYPPDRVVVELTEHARVDDYSVLLEALDRILQRGGRIAVDDTGAGYAGFQHILRLRPDIIKLDTTLTRGIDADPARRSLASALVSFADEIGATIIAEGVEIPGELAVLRRIGIPWAQGYHLAHPGPLPLPACRLAVLGAEGD